MKLRSGKVIGKKQLPTVLQTKLDNNLNILKELLTGHKEVAIKVLNMIADARSFETVYKVERMIQKTVIPDENRALGATYGSLVGLIIGDHNVYPEYNIDHIYHDEIKDVILLFIDTLLIGDQVNQDDMGG